jgi:hypothetical protein
MKHASSNVLDLPLEERAEIAFKAAVRKALEARARKGLPVCIWRDGKVVELSPEEVLESIGRADSD